MSTATPTPRSAQSASASASARAVAVGLEEQRDRAHARRARRGPRASRWRRADRLVAGRDHGVEADPAARAERVDGDVAALGDHRRRRPGSSAGTESPHIARPRRRRRRCRCRSGRRPGSPCARATPRAAPLEPAARLDLAEAGGEDDRAAAAALGRLGDHRSATAAAGIATTTRVDRLGQVGDARHAGAAVHRVALRVDAPDRPSNPARLEVAQHGVAVGAGRGRSRRRRRPSGARAAG